MCLFEAGGFFATAQTAAAANMAIVSLAATAATMTQARVNQKAIFRQQERVNERQQEIASAQAISGFAAKQAEYTQKEGAFIAAQLSSARKATQARAVGTVMAAEGGVEGGSVGEMLGDINKAESEYQMSLLERRKYEDMAYLRSVEAIQLGQYQAGLNSLPTPVPEPDYLGGLLNVGAASYGSYLTVKNA